MHRPHKSPIACVSTVFIWETYFSVWLVCFCGRWCRCEAGDWTIYSSGRVWTAVWMERLCALSSEHCFSFPQMCWGCNEELLNSQSEELWQEDATLALLDVQEAPRHTHARTHSLSLMQSFTVSISYINALTYLFFLLWNLHKGPVFIWEFPSWK